MNNFKSVVGLVMKSSDEIKENFRINKNKFFDFVQRMRQFNDK